MKSSKRGSSFGLFFIFYLFFALSAGINAAETESYQVIEHLLSLPGPCAPIVVDDVIIFTAPSSYRRAGVAFSHEGFSQVHWLRQLLIPQENLSLPEMHGKKQDPYKDSGLLFYIHEIPENTPAIEYRMVINGLWTLDPANSLSRTDSATRLKYSVLELPVREKKPDFFSGPPGSLNFNFKGPPGETVTVAGSFNGWDPFMYELKESPAGTYSLNIPLPPGRYQYVFFHRGERYVDPNNPSRVYSRDGKAASEIVIQ